MKSLYEFTIDRLQEVETEENLPDGSKILRKVKENRPETFIISKPPRSILDDGEVYYHKKYNEYLTEGILPEILLRKMYGNQDGILTEKEKAEYTELYVNLADILTKIKNYDERLEGNEKLNEEENSEYKTLLNRQRKIRDDIYIYENARQSIFENSAESLARNKIVFWWLLKLLYRKEKDGEFTPVFPGQTHEKRAEVFDIINDRIEDKSDKDCKFYTDLLNRAGLLSSLFYMNGTLIPEEFAKLVEDYDTKKKEEEEDNAVDIKT